MNSCGIDVTSEARYIEFLPVCTVKLGKIVQSFRGELQILKYRTFGWRVVLRTLPVTEYMKNQMF